MRFIIWLKRSTMLSRSSSCPLRGVLVARRRLARLSAAQHPEHHHRPQQPAGLQAREIRDLADLLDRRAAVGVRDELLLLLAELDLEQRLLVPRHGDRVEVAADPAEDRPPRAHATHAFDDERLRLQVERDHVVLAGLGHRELVLARRPAEDVEQDLLHVVLDRGQQVLGLERAELDQDRAEPAARGDQPARIQVLAHADLAAQQQVLAEPLVGIAATRVDDPAHV